MCRIKPFYFTSPVIINHIYLFYIYYLSVVLEMILKHFLQYFFWVLGLSQV